MQLFSRNKAIVALSLGALALGACGDDVTVPVAPLAPVVISITPPSALMNVGESVNFAVQISGGSTSSVPTLASCSSSAATVATATVAGSSCRVTAIAAGNATITAAASTGQVTAASVAVAAPAPAITALAVSPSAAQLAVGSSLTVVPTVNRANASVTVVYTYTSSTAAVATVSAAGMVTAVAPGTTTITVSAAGTGTGFAAATLTSAATITVSDRAPGLTSLQVSPATASLTVGGTQSVTASAQGPRAAAATMTYGTSAPAIATVSATGVITAVAAGTATITVTAQSTQDGAFAASSLTGLVTVTVSNLAVVSINISALTQGPTTTSYSTTNGNGIVSAANAQVGQAIDINNTRDQIQMTATLATNGARVDSVVAYVANADGTSRTSVGRQSYPSAAASGPVSLYINTADFTADFTAGTAAVKFANGQKRISVSAFSGATELQSTNSQTVNFNNVDGYAIRATAPAKSATSATGVVYFGGPGATGKGTATITPVFYTAGRTPATVTLSLRQGAAGATQACSEFLVFSAGPYTAQYGSASAVALDTTVIDCSGTSSADDHIIGVSAGTDNSGNALPLVSYAGGFRTSTTIAAPAAIRLDYAAPTITRYSVKGYAGNADSAFVNGTASIIGGFNATTGVPLRYEAADAAGGVGFASTTSARDVTVKVCVTPSNISTSAPTNCTSPVKTGSMTSTIASMGLGEDANNLSNGAYFAQVAERDLLGNEATSVPFAHTIPATATASALPVTATPGPVNVTIAAGTSAGQFGVDLTAPVLATIPTVAQSTTTNPSVTGNIMGFTDAILNTTGLTDSTASDNKNASNAVFVVRVTDSRSGFATCTTLNCSAASGVNVGTYQITRTFANSTPGNTSAIVENLVNTSTTAGPANANVMNASAVSGMPNTYQFSMPVFGATNRILPSGTAGAPTTQTGVVGNEGYYAFAATLTDRAGNTSAAPITKRVLIVNSVPTSVTVAVPTALTGGASVSFDVSASATTEVVAGEVQLSYASLGTGGGSSGSPSIRYPRVAVGGIAASSGVIHAPFAALADGKMSSQTGVGGYALTLTIPKFISTIQVAAGGVPAAPGGVNIINSKPSTITVTAFDPRALATVVGRTGGYPTNVLGALGNAGGASSATAIDPARVSGSATVAKNWTSTATATDPGAGVDLWSLNATLSTATNVVFQATTNATVVSNPFPGGVAIIRRRYDAVSTVNAMSDEQDYIGMATASGMTVANGGTRTWRYSITPTAVVQGNAVTRASYAANDEIRAIGLDAAGNGLATDRTPATAGVVSYALTTAAGVAAKAFGGNLWQLVDNSVPGTSTPRNVNIAEGASPADPIVLISGVTVVITGGAPVMGYGAGAPTFSCLSSDPAVASVAITGTSSVCTVSYVGNGTATIWNVATANNSAGVPNSRLIATFVEARAVNAHGSSPSSSAADLTWNTVDTYNNSGFLVRKQLGTRAAIGTSINAAVTSTSMVLNNCYVTYVAGKTALAANASSLIDPITKTATCVVERRAAPVAPSVAVIGTTFSQAQSATFALLQFTRYVVPGFQLYSLPVLNSLTAVTVPATAATLFTATNTPSLSGVLGVAVPVSVKVVDQYGVAKNGVTIALSAGTNVTCSATEAGTYGACNSITVNVAAGATTATEGIATFFVKPTAAGAANFTVTVSGAFYNSTGLLTATTIPQGQTATYTLSGTAVVAPTLPAAGSGFLTHTGVFPRNLASAAQPYSFTLGGINAAPGGIAAVTYSCAAYTLVGGPGAAGQSASAVVTASYSDASGTPTCTLTPNGFPSVLTAAYISVTATSAGAGFDSVTATPINGLELNRIP